MNDTIVLGIVEWFRIVFLLLVCIFCLFSCISPLVNNDKGDKKNVGIIMSVLYCITNILTLTYAKDIIFIVAILIIFHILLVVGLKKFARETNNFKDLIEEHKETHLGIKAINTVKIFLYFGLITYLLLIAKAIGAN